ncbi:MAG: hypothetical protein COX81_00830 [Candidatus Magasanikbacteria bacterium CG_4_10_14_0_2_um_filter_37_12]|uniref:Uncharacterized protein n=1 Tax=Candidatus Magasanikbacteria bacterium CG_4_10_14_0_2_um_filter_37_12 TaxID=1974637 RepID=A0A2M7V9D0_9BACT|nr:MAG: hypothetical protein COX81_00830 [Candidatus Magasanikbacteria bacterium CG_4_10_14_0_2_um_filter_37_12]
MDKKTSSEAREIPPEILEAANKEIVGSIIEQKEQVLRDIGVSLSRLVILHTQVKKEVEGIASPSSTLLKQLLETAKEKGIEIKFADR